MKVTQINAYVSPTAYLDGKQESVFPIFREDLAILNPAKDYAAIAARGLSLKPSETPVLSHEELDFLETAISRYEMAAVDSEAGILVVFGHLRASCGLLPAILPHGNKSSVAYALSCMGNKRIALSPTVLKTASKHSDTEEIYRHLTDLFYLCTEIFDPSEHLDFRLHCAHIAHLAGCKANVTEFPTGHFPISLHDLRRWTAFLLCVFLTLRGDSTVGSALQLDHADLREFSIKLSHHSEYPRKIPVTDAIYQFLTLPAFSEFHLTRSKGCFTVEAQLQRSRAADLHSPNANPLSLVLQIEFQ